MAIENPRIPAATGATIESMQGTACDGQAQPDSHDAGRQRPANVHTPAGARNNWSPATRTEEKTLSAENRSTRRRKPTDCSLPLLSPMAGSVRPQTRATPLPSAAPGIPCDGLTLGGLRASSKTASPEAAASDSWECEGAVWAIEGLAISGCNCVDLTGTGLDGTGLDGTGLDGTGLEGTVEAASDCTADCTAGCSPCEDDDLRRDLRFRRRWLRLAMVRASCPSAYVAVPPCYRRYGSWR